MGKKRKRRRSSSDTWLQRNGKYVALLGVFAVTVAIATVALNRPGPDTSAAPRVPSSEPSATVTPTSVVFLGDSWVGGAGVEGGGPAKSYAGRTAAALGWTATYLTGGGTGYTRGNSAGEGPFIDRAQAAIDAAPDVVIIQGSSNDYQASSDTIEAAANELFATIRAGLPNVKMYVVGVSDSPDSPSDLMAVSRAAVERAAIANGATFIDSNGWLDQATDFADGYHPNEVGHQKVADQLVAALS